jgi:cardiolipin synthase
VPRSSRRRWPKAWIRARRVRRFERRVGAPVIGGNRVSVSIDGRATFREMFEALAGARRGIGIEMYTWADDRLGTRMAEVVSERSRAGVPVYVILDAFGSLGSERLAAGLMDAGVHVRWYHPLAPWTPSWYPNRRSHRKLVLIDGALAFTGGFNFAEEYCEEFCASAWRELLLRIGVPSCASWRACSWVNGCAWTASCRS